MASETRNAEGTYPRLSEVRTEGWLQDPIEISDPVDRQGVDVLRRSAFGLAVSETSHLGEAQTFYLINNRSDFAGSSWLSDDRETINYAAQRNIPALQTFHILQRAVSNTDIGAGEALALMNKMEERRGDTDGRVLHIRATSIKDFLK